MKKGGNHQSPIENKIKLNTFLFLSSFKLAIYGNGREIITTSMKMSFIPIPSTSFLKSIHLPVRTPSHLVQNRLTGLHEKSVKRMSAEQETTSKTKRPTRSLR